MNKTTNSYPFTAADLKIINDALSALQTAKRIITKAKAAGFQVTEQEDACNTCESCLNGTKQQFFGLKVSEP